MIGGMGERVVERVLAYGDGWFPQPGRSETDDFLRRIGELTSRMDEVDRPLQISAFGARPDPEAIERYEQAGVSRTVFWIEPAERGEVERSLDGVVERLGIG